MHPRFRVLPLLSLLTSMACVERQPGIADGDLTDVTGPSDDTTSTTDDTTSTTDDTTDDSGDSSTGEPEPPPGFLPDADPTDDTCDLFAQDCPEGDKCVPGSNQGDTWDTTVCVTVDGDRQVGEPCNYGGLVLATDDCDASSYCWDVQDMNGELVGTCRGLCQGSVDDPQCPDAHDCLVANGGAIALCIPTCDPIAQDCSAGLACYWAYNTFTCIFTTQPAPGEPCGYINDCYPGTTCIDASLTPNCNGAACCAQFCELDDPSCSVPGTTCVPFFDPELTPMGFENIGVCVVP